MVIQKKQVEIFVVDGIEFATMAEAKAYEKSKAKNFASTKEIEQTIDAKLAKTNFDQYKTLGLFQLHGKALEFATKYFANISVNGKYYDASYYVFNKYKIDSIQANCKNLNGLSDQVIIKLFSFAYHEDHSNGYSSVQKELYKIDTIASILNEIN